MGYFEKKIGNHLKKICKNLSDIVYALLRFCEKKSGEAEIIQEMQEKIQEDVENVKYAKEGLVLAENEAINQEQHIRRLYVLIEYIAINFREKEYETIDKILKEMNL